MRFIVIESTPGYLPENDDPLVVDNYADAVIYANELANELVEDLDFVIVRTNAAPGSYYAIYCEFPDSVNDLGRVIEVIKQDEEEA